MDRREHGAARQGRLTSTLAADLMAGTPTAWNRVLEKIRHPTPFYELGPNTPEPLAWGTMHEDQALAVFWDHHPEYRIHHPRFLRYHDERDALRFKYLGDSPDRMLSLEGGETYCAAVEAKCPYVQQIHWGWLTAGVLPAEHKPQVFFHMMVSGVDECWFTSFDPRTESRADRLFALSIRQSDDLEYATRMSRYTDKVLEVLDAGETFEIVQTTADTVRSMFQ